MPQPLIITLLLFAFVLPILGAVVLRLLMRRLAAEQLYSAAALLLGLAIASVLVLARSNIPSLQIGNLSILLPVTAPEDAFLPIVPTTPAEQAPAPATLAASAPITATAALTPTVAPSVTATAALTATVKPSVTATTVPATAAATPTATAEPTAAPTAPPEPTAIPPTAIAPTAAPAPPAAQRTYTVQPGDTLLSIAKKFDTTVTAIIKANNLTPQQADSLHVGQKLVIP